MKSLLLLALGLVSMVAESELAFSREGFHSIAELEGRSGFRKGFSPRKNCGSVRIHDSRPIYLSALHCVVEGVPPARTVALGNEMNWENLVYYDGLAGKTLPSGVRVLASGGCFTGFALDVLNGEKNDRARRDALDCAKGDWVIYEDPRSTAKECVAVAPYAAKTGDALVDLGAPKRRITRKVGMTDLDGRVFAEGRLLDLAALVADKRYAFGKIWDRLLPVFRTERGERSLLLSDAEAIPGMSGGPILDAHFELVGVTTLALVPNDLWRFDLPALDEGYLYGIHGGIRIEEILAFLDHHSTRLVPEFFHCPPARTLTARPTRRSR